MPRAFRGIRVVALYPKGARRRGIPLLEAEASKYRI
jgi:hypothetical protein